MSDMANHDSRQDTQPTSGDSTQPIHVAFQEFFDDVDSAVATITPTEIDAHLAQLFANNIRPLHHADLPPVERSAIMDIAAKAILSGEREHSPDPIDVRIMEVHTMADEAVRRFEDLEAQTALAIMDAAQERIRLEEATSVAISHVEGMLAKAEDVILDGQASLAETTSQAIAQMNNMLEQTVKLLTYALRIHAETRAERERITQEARQILADTRNMWRVTQEEAIAAVEREKALNLFLPPRDSETSFDFFRNQESEAMSPDAEHETFESDPQIIPDATHGSVPPFRSRGFSNVAPSPATGPNETCVPPVTDTPETIDSLIFGETSKSGVERPVAAPEGDGGRSKIGGLARRLLFRSQMQAAG